MRINYFKFKRFFDLIISLMLLILLFPLIIFIITILFIFNGRPIFYIQKRSGLNKKHFSYNFCHDFIFPLGLHTGRPIIETSLDTTPTYAIQHNLVG